MNGKIFCLMTGGLYLTDTVRELLFFTALRMFNDKEHRATVQSSECDGEIRTQFEPASLGVIGGLTFTAEIHTETASSTVRFIVRTRDLEGIEEGAWARVRPERANAHAMN